TTPRVPAGTYKVVLNKGKETYAHEFELQYDPSSLLSPEERIRMQNTIMKLYNMTQELAYLVYEIDEMVTVAETLKKENPKAVKSATALINDLNALKKTLVITTGDNYVGSAEPQLREKLANLYSKVASGYTVPSPSEMDNLQVIEEQFNKGKADLEKIRSKRWSNVARYLKTPFELKSYEAFLED
ncbi:MAG: hypothetical protein KDD04_12195, partial [Sinomicrobium sp.]|nr:hypothetical protein [Sinomicrobium sp.]